MSLKKVTPFLLALVVFVGCSGKDGSKTNSANSAEDTKAIQAAFDSYQKSALKNDGKTAAKVVSSNTINEYQKYIDWSLKADKKTLKSLSLLNKMQVLIIKARVPANQIRKMDGKAIFIYAVDRGWVSKRSIEKGSIKDIKVSGNKATATLWMGTQETPFKSRFVKEDGSWKYDLISLLNIAEPAMKAQIKKTGMSEDEFLLFVIERTTGKKVPASIWKPIGK